MKSDFDPRKAHESGDTLPEQANVYVPPRPLAQISDHRTIDFKAIRISAELDPRQAKTQLRLSAPPAPARRGLPLFIFGSAVVLALFGVVIYMAVARPAPSPLMTTEPLPPAPETPVTTATQAAPAGPVTTALPAATTASPEPAMPAAAPSSPPSGAHATSPRAKSSGPRSAPHKAKVVREPWLE